MRLGFWNRLAIVAGVLFSLGGSTWMIVSEQMKSNERMQLGYSACIDGVGIPNSGLTVESCGETWFQSRGGVGWEEWIQAVGALALLAMIIYGIVWFAVWIVKWVMRGRSQVS